MPKNKIAAVVLAAGYSSRMGSFKPLLPLGSQIVLERVAQAFFRAGLEEVRVVVGHRADELIPVVESLGARWVLNRDYPLSMFSSVQAAVKTLDSRISAYFITPVDCPFVNPVTLQEMLGFFPSSGAKIVYPCFLGQRGHPPLISTDYNGLIVNSPVSYNLRDFLQEYEKEAAEVETFDLAVLLDMNEPEEYQRNVEFADFLDQPGDTVPTEKNCRLLLELLQVPRQVREHSVCVARLGQALADSLNTCGLGIDTRLVVAGGLLHDMCKGFPDHALAGGKTLEKLGYPALAEVVRSHTDLLAPSRKNTVGAGEVVYLADKLVKGTRPVTLEMRYMKRRQEFIDNEEVLALIGRRFKRAQDVKAQMENILGFSLEAIVQSVFNEPGIRKRVDRLPKPWV